MTVSPINADVVAQALGEVRRSLGESPVERIEALAGGVSNLTFRVDRGNAAPVVIRVERESGIFEPYDVVRESRVLRALAGTAVPVPEVLAVATESQALKAAFFVMEFVNAPHMGEVPRSTRVTANDVDAVARIHEVPWLEAGLAFLDAPEVGTEGAARDLALVEARAARYGQANDPFIAELGGWLGAHLATTLDLVFCQGDINVFTNLFREQEVGGGGGLGASTDRRPAVGYGTAGGAVVFTGFTGSAGSVADRCGLRGALRGGSGSAALLGPGGGYTSWR